MKALNWWEQETPITATTSKNVLRYYPCAGKLQVSRPDFTDPITGAPRVGKTVTLELEGLRDNFEAVDIVYALYERLAKEG